MPKHHKKRVPDLNTEVANAIGAATKTTVPKGEDLLGSEEARRELEKARLKEGAKAKKMDR
jgi:hypothetical protein